MLQAGMLEKHADLAPDEVYLVTFLGNDFWDAYALDSYRRDFPLHSQLPEYKARAAALAEVKREALFQGGNQIVRSLAHPGEAEAGIALTLDGYENARTICQRLGSKLTIVLLPTKFDVDTDNEATIAELERVGEWPADARHMNRELGRKLHEQAVARGFEVLDAEPALRAVGTPQDWTADYHLSTAGHATVAQFRIDSRFKPAINAFLPGGTPNTQAKR